MKIIKLFLSMALFTVVGNTLADNLAVEDFMVTTGNTQTISIELVNPDSEYIMVEFWLSLPEGVSIPIGDDGFYMAEGNASRFTRTHTLEVSKQDSFYHFLAFSSRNAAFLGNSGEFISVTIEAASDAQVGTYTALIFNQLYNDPDKNEFKPDDVPFNITIEESDGRIHFCETDTSLPTYTAGEKGDVSMIRTINAQEWSTIVLPFTLTKAKAESENIFGPDVQLAEFSSFEVEYADEEDVTPDAITLKFTTYAMTARKGMIGGKLYLIKTNKKVESFVADDVTLASSVTEVPKSCVIDEDISISGKFTGSLVKTVVPEDGLFLSGNKFWYSVGKTNIKAFRGWFELGAVLDKQTDFGANISFVVDDEPASVDGVPSACQKGKGNVYTIQGQYVGRDINLKRLPRGIYIIDGKKRVIK